MKLLKTALVIVLGLSFSACTPKITPVAYNCPKIQLPADPIAPANKLTDKSQPDEVMKAWVVTAIAYRDWNRAVRRQIESSFIH